jgi:DNA repair protein RadD
MLLPRQKEAEEKILSYLKSKDKRPGIVVGPTGFGKSYIISSVANKFDGPVLVLQPNKELLEQNLEKLKLMGGDATVYSASLNTKEASSLTYATLGSIVNKVDVFKELGVKTVLVDECDYGYSPAEGSQFKKFLNKLKPTKIVGYTATPFSLKAYRNQVGDNISKLVMINRMRPRIFKHFIDVVQIQEVIKEGRWSKLVYINHDFDTGLLQYNTSGSEFTDSSVKKAVEANGVNNKIYLRVKELLKDKSKSMLVFVDSVENGEKFAELFGESAAFVGDKTKKKERGAILDSFKDPKGKVRVVFNHSVLTTGFDHPELNHIFLGRPTNSLRLYCQTIGRGVRIHENKEKCYIEDLCGNVERFGYVENLTVEDFPNYGWGIFNGETLLTGVPLDAPVKTTKSNINDDYSGGMKFWYGKYKNTPVRKVGRGYLLYQAEWIDGLDKPSKNLVELRKVIGNLVDC